MGRKKRSQQFKSRESVYLTPHASLALSQLLKRYSQQGASWLFNSGVVLLWAQAGEKLDLLADGRPLNLPEDTRARLDALNQQVLREHGHEKGATEPRKKSRASA